MKSPALQDAARYKRLAAEYPNPSCERSFANLFCYRHEGVEIEFREDRVLIWQGGDGLWQFPAGKPSTAEELRRLCPGHSIYDVPPDFQPEGCFEVTCDPGEADYIYRNDRLAGFTGEKLRKKHNLCRQFDALCPEWRVETITEKNLPLAAQFASDCNRARGDAGFLAVENRALHECWEHFFAPELEFSGILLFAEPGRVAGFAVISPLAGVPEGMCDVHFEKADHTIKGAPQKLTAALAEAACGRFARMNREQDMNVPGIRQAKNSLDPEYLWRRRTLVPAGARD